MVDCSDALSRNRQVLMHVSVHVVWLAPGAIEFVTHAKAFAMVWFKKLLDCIVGSYMRGVRFGQCCADAIAVSRINFLYSFMHRVIVYDWEHSATQYIEIYGWY